MTDGDPNPTRTLKLTVAYDGTDYAGWQYQNDKPTVQNTLENAIATVTGQHARILASGRTDAGVHALGQVVGWRTDSHLPPDVLLRALNANLPHDIAVLEVAEAPPDFHAIAHVVRKRYRYVIHDGPVRDVFQRRYAWHFRHGRLDVEAMQRAAQPLLGTHDFCSFESSGAERKTSIRTVFELTIAQTGYLLSPLGRGTGGEGSLTDNLANNIVLDDSDSPQNFILFEIEADGFLYNMVRAIVGTLVEVGRGQQPIEWPGEVLRAMDRRQAGPTAPPQGLFLLHVDYE
jgi:tRNA pseudouridine38-40 synthase